jgi:putative ABC transport system permease protein
MPLWKIAWRSIQRRSLASGLTTLSMALGVTLVVAVLLIHGVIAESFRSNASLGYNLIMGAKGGKLQLVLNTVFYLSEPVENIPYSFYLEFLGADQRPDGKDGHWKDYVDRVIPLCLGDYYRDFRVVGTIPAMFDNYVYDEDTGEAFQFAQGRNFEHFNSQHGYFEAIVGARVAREAGLSVGDTIAATHGSAEGSVHGDKFHVVGILAPSGTPNDRAVFVNMEGFYLLEGHAKPAHDTAGHTANTQPPVSPPSGVPLPSEIGQHADDHDSASHGHDAPLPIAQREVTALLVKTSPIITRGLSNTINEGSVAQAVFPVGEITTLFNRIVRPFQRVLLALTAMICVVSGISILVSIYNSMSDRRREIAIMRSLGAGRRTVMAVVLLEAIILAVGGGLIGWVSGHLLIAAANPWIEAETGVTIGPLDTAPPVNLVEYLSPNSSLELYVSTEWILIPSLIILAVVVGFLPALAAYRTDVAEALTANP